MHTFASFLETRLQQSLPGSQSQFKMAPEPVESGPTRKMMPAEDANQSSVLVLLFPNENNELELTLTLRSSGIDHGGQISFPGGRAEEGESSRETALREAHEEIGINQSDVIIAGQLSMLYVNYSNNSVTPVVGFLPTRPPFHINPAEVEEIFTVELDSLLTKKNLIKENWDLREHTYRVPYWNVHRVPLWGATAMMLSELMDLYREYQEQDYN